MDIEKIREKTKIIIKDFVDAIGLDGDEYAKIEQVPILWNDNLGKATGEYITPEINVRNESLDDINSENKNKIEKNGVILVNSNLNKDKVSRELLVTIIHETIHANRNVLAYDSFEDGENKWSYIYKNEYYQQKEPFYSEQYGDPSQDMLKGSINTVWKKNENDYFDINDIVNNEKIDKKMKQQKSVDEALVEIMANVAVDLYANKRRGNNVDIWDAIKKYRDKCENDYNIKLYKYLKNQTIMCDIILKHKDFELFYWMLDPIMYSNGDLHYDVFEKYTKNDKELVNELFKENKTKNLNNNFNNSAFMIGNINILNIKNSIQRNESDEEREQ